MKSVLTFLITLSVILLGWGCHSKNSANVQESSQKLMHENNVEMQEKLLDASDVPAIGAEEQKSFALSVNAFGFEFYSKLDGNDNILFSPFSLHNALAMTSYGARGETLDEIQKVLHLGVDREKAALLNGKMRLKLRYDGQDECSFLNVANRVWIDSDLELVDGFVSMLDRAYRAGVQRVNFVHQGKGVADIINQWAALNTDQKIKKLVSDKEISSDTLMMLVNALYFKAKWAYPFDSEETMDEDFYLNEIETKKVRMMKQRRILKLYEGEGYRALSMPYKGDKYAMIFILPDTRTGLEELMRSFRVENIQKIQAGAESKLVALNLPKFRVEQRISAKDILNRLGISKAFSRGDFSGISDSDIMINDVIHKSVIEVSEDGTEVFSSSSVVMVEMPKANAQEVVFRADHPFAYVLVHIDSGAMLFMGRYVK